MQSSAWLSTLTNTVFLMMVVGIPLYGWRKRVPVFETFVVGARESLSVIFRVFPFLLGMLVAIGMLHASGAFTLITSWLQPFFSTIGFPSELLPLVLVRPLSGGAASGVFADIIQNYGGDSYLAQLAATMMGSTETTFYVLAVYFGAVGIMRTRHAVPVGLLADLAGVIASIFVCRMLLA